MDSRYSGVLGAAEWHRSILFMSQRDRKTVGGINQDREESTRNVINVVYFQQGRTQSGIGNQNPRALSASTS